MSGYKSSPGVSIKVRVNMKLIVLIFLVFGQWTIAQDAEKRGLEILSLARKVIYKDQPVASLENSRIRIISQVSSDDIDHGRAAKIETSKRLYREQYFSLGLQSKAKFYRLDYLGNKHPIDIRLLASGQINGEWLGEIKRSKYIPNQLYEAIKHETNIRGNIDKNLFMYVSPVFLQFFEDVKVRYLGKAETPEGKRANVVGITNDRPAETQFLFDENTYELIATIYKRKDAVGKYIDTFSDHCYFSDRKISNGLFLPTRLTFKRTLTEHNKDSKKLKRKKTVLQKSKIFVELNSKFEKDEFALPRNAKSLASRAKELGAIWKAK